MILVDTKETRRARLAGLVLGAALGSIGTALPAADYAIDTAHSFVEFRIKHLGYSWLYGRFNRFSGHFSYDADNPHASAISVSIDTASVDTNHAERDKHLRGSDFLDVAKYPEATFESTKYSGDAQSGTLEGMLTLHGVTKPISIHLEKLGEGNDPWGGTAPDSSAPPPSPDGTSESATTSDRPASRWSWSSASRAFGNSSQPTPTGARARVRRAHHNIRRSVPSRSTS